MASRHRKTYEAIQANPVRANVSWDDAVAMARAFGIDIVPGTGSMFSFERPGAKVVIHRPHPGKELSKASVRTFRRFLLNARVNPDDL